jgi:hypothetical protein
MSFTLDSVAILSALYLIGLVEFAVWCHLAPVSTGAGASDE